MLGSEVEAIGFALMRGCCLLMVTLHRREEGVGGPTGRGYIIFAQ